SRGTCTSARSCFLRGRCGSYLPIFFSNSFSFFFSFFFFFFFFFFLFFFFLVLFFFFFFFFFSFFFLLLFLLLLVFSLSLLLFATIDVPAVGFRFDVHEFPFQLRFLFCEPRL